MLDPATLSSLKVTELKAELRKRGLPVGGLKQALVERLTEQVLQERAAAAEAEAIAQAAKDEEEAALKDERGGEVVNGDEVAPDPQPEPLPEPMPGVAEEKKDFPVPQSAPGVIAVETVQKAAVDKSITEPEIIQEEAPALEAPTEVEPAVTEASPEPELETEAVVATEVVGEEVVFEERAVFEEKVVESEAIESTSDPEAKLETEPVETGAVKEVAEEEIGGTAPEPKAELETEPVETGAVKEIAEEEIGGTAPEPKAEFEDEVVEKTVLDEVMIKAEIAPDVAPEDGAIVEQKEVTPVGQSISQSEPEAEMERVKSEEIVVPAAGEPVREIVNDEDSRMVDVSPLSLPVEKSMVSEPAPVRDDTAVVSTSKPEPETDPQQPSIDLMDTSEEQTDIRKRKRRSVTPTTPSVRVAEPGNQQPNEGAISKKPRRDSTENQPQRTRPKDARFKGLFNDSSSTTAANNPSTASQYYNQATDQATNQLTAQMEEEDDTPIPPSIHPATRALYIRNFARPLSEPALKAHLTALASPPSSTSTAITHQPSESPIEYIYLDTIKTHALIIFTTLTAATRVRVGIHTKVWPNERSRKPLWADFVPEESIAGWVNREKQRGPGARWEVVYDREAGEGGVRAELEEVGGRRIGLSGGVGVEVLGAPTGPRGERRGAQAADREFGARSTAPNFAAAATGPTTISNTVQRTTTTGGGGRVVVKDLDQLFRSTTAKPKLYWMPVDPDISRERLAAYERGRGNRGNSGNAGAGSSRRRR